MNAPNVKNLDAPPRPVDDYGRDGQAQQDQEPNLLDRLRAALVDSAGLDSVPEPEPLVDGTMYRDSLAWINGKRGNAKTFVAIDIAGCVGTGENWQGHPVHQGLVLFLAAEGVSGMRWRVRAWEQAMDRKMTDVQWLPLPVQANDPYQWANLIALATEMQPVLIIIDTQARVTVGMEENAAKDMGIFVDRLEQLRRATRACITVVHHEGRGGEHMRGSTALEGAANTILRVAKDADEVTVVCAKQKDAKEFGDITLRLVPMGDSAVLMESEPDAGPTPGRMAAALKMARDWHDMFGTDEVASTRLIDAIDQPDRTVYRHIRELCDAGIARKRQQGRAKYYQLVTEPDPQTGAWQ